MIATILTTMKTWPFTPLHRRLLLIFFFFFLLSASVSRDTITTDSSLAYTDTLDSSNGIFTLGFFTRGNKNHSYLGIWYTNKNETIVWIANRDNPMDDTTGNLSVSVSSPNLQLRTNSGEVVWSVNVSNMVNPIAQILDTGNFVLKDQNAANTAWESFDYPTDTLLPGMKFGWIGGQNHYLTSWTSTDDPSSSEYTVKLVQSAWTELIIWNGSNPVFRTGPWNGVDQFSGVPEIEEDNDLKFELVTDQNDTYINMTGSPTSRIVLEDKSHLRRYLLDNSVWQQHWSVPSDICEEYNRCGQYGMCTLNSSNYQSCTCLEEFEPTFKSEWIQNETEDGCYNPVALSYTENDGFLHINNVKLPDTANVTVDSTIGLKECKKRCLTNSSCTAYSNLNGNSGCAMWMYSLNDMRQLDEGGWTLYYRVAASQVPAKSSTSKKAAIIVVSSALGLLILACFAYFIRKTLANRNKNLASTETQSQMSQESTHPIATSGNEILNEGSPKGIMSTLPVFHASVISAATENFSLSNKLGEGGFGTVFKGELEGGRRVAVKRLKYSSTEGLGEFKNEVKLIAGLQHFNLVLLLGYCIEGGERMLLYEYMENKSLDTFLFDREKSSQLDWQKRFDIIMGIARGILYLHQDSRLRVIHRDLKASNILLDEHMNPKISDFGIARIFGRHEKDSVTSRVIGTYGYMSPEYALYGAFSVKSDVYSFGVLVLEIISGRKISEILIMQPLLNLLNYAWALWNDGKAIKLLDASIHMNSVNKSEIIRCIQVALCCVQDNPEDRPHISEAILMLNSSNMILPRPKQPAYFSNRASTNLESTSSGSVFDTDITVAEPR